MHWADQYVGKPFERGGRGPEFVDCWGLVRLVLAEQAGINLPRYDEDDPDGGTIENHAKSFKTVPLAEMRQFDCVLMLSPVRVGLIFKEYPVHIGVALDAKHVLHIEEGICSRIEPAASLRIHSVVRVTG